MISAPADNACNLPRATSLASGAMPQLVDGYNLSASTYLSASRSVAATSSGVSLGLLPIAEEYAKLLIIEPAVAVGPDTHDPLLAQPPGLLLQPGEIACQVAANPSPPAKQGEMQLQHVPPLGNGRVPVDRIPGQFQPAIGPVVREVGVGFGP